MARKPMLFFAKTPPPSQPSDADTAQRIAAGDRVALADLYAREAPRVYRYALAMSGSEAIAADVTQDTFMAFAHKPGGYDPVKGALQGYLMGVARHHVLATLRQTHDPLDTVADEPVDADDPDSVLIAKTTHAQLMAAIAQLPVVFREALILVELREMSYAQAAALAGIELNTLRTRLHRAKKRLAELLGAHHAIPAKSTS
jgi:RNA polymerase sigma-70 factor (ECF subfamily)